MDLTEVHSKDVVPMQTLPPLGEHLCMMIVPALVTSFSTLVTFANEGVWLFQNH